MTADVSTAQGDSVAVERLRAAVRDVPDFPKPGIVFKDITPILADPELFPLAVDTLAVPYLGRGVTKVAVIDARGFIFGSALAYKLAAGLVLIRKKGKLPHRTREESYSLEYGTACLELHEDSLRPGDRVLLVDDLLATGGTARAAVNLIESIGGRLVAVDVLVELSFLEGREKLKGYPVRSTIVY